MPSIEFAAFVEQLRSNPMPTELHAMREAYEGMGRMFPLPEGAVLERTELGGRPAEWHGGRTKADRGLTLFLHGGGYAIGSLNTHRHLAAEIARLTCFPTVALDYRLGPEHRFPAAVDDALAAYRQLLLDYPGSRIVLAGDSAGGGLVMATLLAARTSAVAKVRTISLATGLPTLSSEIRAMTRSKGGMVTTRSRAVPGSTSCAAALASTRTADLRSRFLRFYWRHARGLRLPACARSVAAHSSERAVRRGWHLKDPGPGLRYLPDHSGRIGRYDQGYVSVGGDKRPGAPRFVRCRYDPCPQHPR